jgi:hypothetical protein
MVDDDPLERRLSYSRRLSLETGRSEIKVRTASRLNLETAAIWGVPGDLASESKCLARSNKSPDRGKTTKKQTRQAWTRKTAPAAPPI